MESVYEKLMACPKFENANIILSVFDGYGTFEQQLQSAINLKNRFQTAFVNFIIKINFPVSELLKGVRHNKERLDMFSILGFTEKELGRTLKERMLNLVNIRQQLTTCGWHGHIHIYLCRIGAKPCKIILLCWSGYL